MKPVHRTTLFLGLGLLVLGAFRSARLARADAFYRSARIESIRQATLLEPGNALYPAGVAEWVAAREGDPRPDLVRAIGLNPRDPALHIRLGLEQEQRGNSGEAERQLLVAADVSAKFTPRWTLANFYFRAGNEGSFWRWARAALSISYGDRRPLFDLCWKLGADAREILARAVPGRRDVRRDFTADLLRRGEWTAAARLSGALVEDASPAERLFFLGVTDTLLRNSRPVMAFEVWNSLCRRGILPYRPRGPGTPPRLTNTRFEQAPLRHGFDWRFTSTEGLHIAPAPAGLRINLGGDQPENCGVLTQFVVLPPGAYRLRCRYSTKTGIFSPPSASTGLHWRVYYGRNLLASSPALPLSDRGDVTLEFRVPAGARGGRIALHHLRASGATRMEGTVTLAEVTIEQRNSSSGTMRGQEP